MKAIDLAQAAMLQVSLLALHRSQPAPFSHHSCHNCCTVLHINQQASSGFSPLVRLAGPGLVVQAAGSYPSFSLMLLPGAVTSRLPRPHTGCCCIGSQAGG